MKKLFLLPIVFLTMFSASANEVIEIDTCSEIVLHRTILEDILGEDSTRYAYKKVLRCNRVFGKATQCQQQQYPIMREQKDIVETIYIQENGQPLNYDGKTYKCIAK